MPFLKRLFSLFLTLSFLLSLFPQSEETNVISPVQEEMFPSMITSVGGNSPSYPYGDDRLKSFISNQLKWPVKNFCGEGTVIISLIVDEKGYPSDYKIRRGFHKAFDEEALRVLKMIRKWKPGTDSSGKPVRMQMHFPIRFTLK